MINLSHHRFISRKSCTTGILFLKFVVYIDFPKAFDTSAQVSLVSLIIYNIYAASFRRLLIEILFIKVVILQYIIYANDVVLVIINLFRYQKKNILSDFLFEEW